MTFYLMPECSSKADAYLKLFVNSFLNIQDFAQHSPFFARLGQQSECLHLHACERVQIGRGQ